MKNHQLSTKASHTHTGKISGLFNFCWGLSLCGAHYTWHLPVNLRTWDYENILVEKVTYLLHRMSSLNGLGIIWPVARRWPLHSTGIIQINFFYYFLWTSTCCLSFSSFLRLFACIPLHLRTLVWVEKYTLLISFRFSKNQGSSLKRDIMQQCNYLSVYR